MAQNVITKQRGRSQQKVPQKNKRGWLPAAAGPGPAVPETTYYFYLTWGIAAEISQTQSRTGQPHHSIKDNAAKDYLLALSGIRDFSIKLPIECQLPQVSASTMWLKQG